MGNLGQVFNNLRVRLILLVLIAVIPILLITYLSGLEQRRLARINAEQEANRYTRLVASYHQDQVERGLQAMYAITLNPVNYDPQTCGSYLSRLAEIYPSYAGFTLVNLDGSVRCSSIPTNNQANLSDRAYFQQALQTGEMVVGHPIIGRLSNRAIEPVATLITNEDGSPNSVIVASLDLQQLVGYAEQLRMPSESTLLLIDSDGTVLLRYPENKAWIGKQMTNAPIVQEILERGDGTTEAAGLDNVVRLYSITSLLEKDQQRIYATVGIPSSIAYASAEAALQQNMLWLALSALGSLAIAWFAGDALFLRVVSLTAERDRAEQQLRELNRALEARVAERTADLERALARLQSFISADLVGVIVASADGRVVEANDYYLSLLGYTRDQLKADQIRWDTITPAEYLPADQKALEELRERGVCTPYEKEYVRTDGSRVWVYLADAMLPGEEGLIAAVVLDITERKRLELHLADRTQELEKANTQQQAELTIRRRIETILRQRERELQRSNRELQDFAYIASHDLQEPLRKIQAFGQRLVRMIGDQPGEDTAADYAQRMYTSAERMQTMINDLLAYSRVTTRGGNFMPTDLNEIVREVLEDLSVRIQETGGQVEVEPMAIIDADPLQMRQLLQNLISNALKFHRPDVPPVVTIRCAEVPGEDGQPPQQITLQIEDNGIGFEEKYLEKIFQPFQRLHGRGEYEGSGIGLAICQKIINRHGGSVTATSQPNAGARFIITLPIHQTNSQGEP